MKISRWIAPLLIVVICCSGWGFLVHRTVNQLAVYQLPKKMQPFFHEHMNYLVKYAVRPDQRRFSDHNEAPKHFIDAEPYGDSSLWKMPQTWNGAIAIYTTDTLYKYGYVPYWVMEMKNKLTRAFRNKNRDSIIFYATDMGHYIADAHVPLHTTENYDGQLTDQKGLHSLWESTIPELEISQYQLYNSHKAKYLRHPEKDIWNAVRTANSLVSEVLQLEREATKQFTDSTKYRIQRRNGNEVKSYTSAFARAYGKLLGNMINERLLKSSNLIADFWYTCWIDGGKPDLNAMMQINSAEDKSNLKKEMKAYRTNQLLKENLLIARQSKEEE